MSYYRRVFKLPPMALAVYLLAGGQAICAGPAIQNETAVQFYRFGLLPYLSPEALTRTWGPFAAHLEKSLHARLTVKSAPDFKTFIQRTKDLKYDFLITAPHFAALAKKQWGYRIIAGFSKELSGDIVVGKDAPYKNVASLKGTVLATPDRLAAITLLGELALIEQGLVIDKDITVKHTPSHNNALISVVEGKADAAVAVGGLYLRMSPKIKNGLRLLAKTKQVPHVMFIANPKLSDETLNALTESVLSPESQANLLKFETNLGWGSLATVSEDNLQRLGPLVTLLKSRLAH
ncbi:MAG TPA: phosphate/phosphite/phosphonate ABC transporter substrate-binding protein [Acidiferrobacteraceae bacterium]|nr:phosphate/phosphite/phosphonate ABC transporter substrate-binding protein [Acidiferrobacteraceae bacterium]